MGQGVSRQDLMHAVDAALADPARWPHALSMLSDAGAPIVSPEMVVETASSQMNLTDAESKILAHVVEGHDASQIASTEALSVSTVRTHLAHLREKFGVKRTIDVLRIALTNALGAS